jgi:tRNA threonylcarbamoyladenosine biosynthesis protein TsaB
MKVLGIETSTRFCGVALVDEKRLIAEYRVSLELKHAERLLPLIDELLKASQTALSDLNAIAVSIGPGSFTGLRVGVATAKGLAIGCNLPLIAVPTLSAMAAPFCHAQSVIVPMISARKNEVYWATFSASCCEITRLSPDACDSLERVLEQMGHQPQLLFIGEGAILYRDQIEKDFKGVALFPPIGLQSPLAACVADMGRLRWMKGEGERGEEVVPVYLHVVEQKGVTPLRT